MEDSILQDQMNADKLQGECEKTLYRHGEVNWLQSPERECEREHHRRNTCTLISSRENVRNTPTSASSSLMKENVRGTLQSHSEDNQLLSPKSKCEREHCMAGTLTGQSAAG